MKTVGQALVLGIVLSTGAMSSARESASVQVSIRHVEWIKCGEVSGLKITLQVALSNVSKEPLVLGRIGIEQERLWKQVKNGSLELIRTTDTPDDFAPPSDSDSFANTREHQLSRQGAKSFTITHYVYLAPSDLQLLGGNPKVIASFHITNVRKNGSASDYWSGPISIAVPVNCKVK